MFNTSVIFMLWYVFYRVEFNEVDAHESVDKLTQKYLVTCMWSFVQLKGFLTIW